MRQLGLFAVVSALTASSAARAVEAGKFDGTERLEVGSTRLLIMNFATYQCGARLVFDRENAVAKAGNVEFTVRTVPAAKDECGCKAHTNNFHFYRARRVKTDKDGMTIPDELVAKGRIEPSSSKSFAVAAIHRAERKFDYYFNFDCTD